MAKATVNNFASSTLDEVLRGAHIAVAVPNAVIRKSDAMDHAITIKPVTENLIAKAVAARANTIKSATHTVWNSAIDLSGAYLVAEFLLKRIKASHMG